MLMAATQRVVGSIPHSCQIIGSIKASGVKTCAKRDESTVVLYVEHSRLLHQYCTRKSSNNEDTFSFYK